MICLSSRRYTTSIFDSTAMIVFLLFAFFPIATLAVAVPRQLSPVSHSYSLINARSPRIAQVEVKFEIGTPIQAQFFREVQKLLSKANLGNVKIDVEHIGWKNTPMFNEREKVQFKVEFPGKERSPVWGEVFCSGAKCNGQLVQRDGWAVANGEWDTHVTYQPLPEDPPRSRKPGTKSVTWVDAESDKPKGYSKKAEEKQWYQACVVQ
ncbi:hypothetical protein GGU10DRAFT_341874 [Lentinula aff. detonsa]|uniref:Uncharacterized protein n=1 Tax=Lentinula aff. detonsa TaxID=2804958 RepID=A0AA38NRX7_9AGAR|nr:hypothetical protein GGU10DRAFT_341874 [Lentinula aff. detonsa]